MKVYAKRPNDKKGDKLPVATVRQSTATGVLHQKVITITTMCKLTIGQ